MNAHIATCQFCGDTGIEEDGDPMPNTCPKCFEEQIAPVFDKAATLSELTHGLEATGMDTAAIARALGKEAAVDNPVAP